MRLRWYYGLALLLGLLVLGGVVFTVIDAMNFQRLGFAGVNIPGHMAASYQYLDDTIDSHITVDEGETLVLEYELRSEEGELLLDIQDPQGEQLMRLEGNEAGRAEIEAPFTGTYRLVVYGEETRGEYDIRWDVVPQGS
jgi:hypothetical protein